MAECSIRSTQSDRKPISHVTYQPGFAPPTNVMDTPPSIRPRAFSDSVLDRLARLSPLAERLPLLFTDPLGPDDGGLYLPRFVAFGPNSTASDARITLLAGLGERDEASSLAAFDLLDFAIAAPEAIGGVVLDVVPVANRGTGDLWTTSWTAAGRPELDLLEREFRRLSPHAVVQVRGGSSLLPRGVVRGVSLSYWLDHASPSIAAASWFEQPVFPELQQGIDALVPDLPFRPLELQLTLGRDREGNDAALRAIVQRIRELLAHAQNL